MAESNARLVALSWVDNGGIARVKVIPSERLGPAERDGVGASTTFAVFQGDDVMAASHGLEIPTGDLRLVPDRASLASGRDGWSWCAADQHDTEGEPLPTCSRTFLRRTAARATEAGLELRLAYELEWHAERVDQGLPLHVGPGYGLATLRTAGSYLQAVAARLGEHGVPLVQIHPEYSPGQVEVSTAPADPVTAADRSVLGRHLVRTLEEATGVRASFSPLVGPGLLGNGHHLHVSVWRGGVNLLGAGDDEHGLTPEGRAFLAGILEELPALVALGCSSPLSYRRLAPGRWTGAYTCWGVENREAPLRLIRGSRSARPGAANVELKSADASGNPYLLAGGVIAAGLHGLERGLELRPQIAVDPATLGKRQRLKLRAEPLPATGAEAADALVRSATLRAALGDVLCDTVAAVRRTEWERHGARSDEELQDLYRWRY